MIVARIIRSALPVIALAIGGCTQVLPEYQPTNANVLAIQAAGQSKLATGDFIAEPGREAAVNDLTIRASRLGLPNKLSFPDYIREALNADLKQSGRYDPAATIVVSGVLRKNTVGAPAFGDGAAEIIVRFKVERDRATVFDRVLTQRHEWGSSFIGAIAIPGAAQNYGATVGLLINQLFGDPDFRQATR